MTLRTALAALASLTFLTACNPPGSGGDDSAGEEGDESGGLSWLNREPRRPAPPLGEDEVNRAVPSVRRQMRQMATALEAYQVDWNDYPPAHGQGVTGYLGIPGQRPRGTPYAYLHPLTTPISYMPSLPLDPFSTRDWLLAPSAETLDIDTQQMRRQTETFTYYAFDADLEVIVRGETRAPTWVIQSAGPDGVTINLQYLLANSPRASLVNLSYDPTNGTVSAGSIFYSNQWGDGPLGQ